MAKPVIEMQIGMMVNRKRCRRKSENVATTILKTKAAAHGGTENN